MYRQVYQYKFLIFSVKCIYVFRWIFSVSIHGYLTQHSQTGFPSAGTLRFP